MVSRNESGADAEFLWEQRRSWLCLGWHQPLVTPRWTDKKGQSLVAASGRPRTRAYRRVFKGKDDKDGQQEWEWCIVVNEQTDEAGWSYGGCGFWELLGAGGENQHRMSLRSRPATLDLVKRRKWVHRSHAASLRRSGQMGSTKVMDPKQIREKQQAVAKELQEAKAAIWDLIDELDQSIHIKDMYMALLDPVALNRVSTAHVKTMLDLQQSVLKLPAVLLAPVEVWKEALPEAEEHDRRSVVSDTGAGRPSQYDTVDSSYNLAQRFVSRTRLLVRLTQKTTVMVAGAAGDLVSNTGKSVKSVINKMTPGGNLSSYGSTPNPNSVVEPSTATRPAFSNATDRPSTQAASASAASAAHHAPSAEPSAVHVVVQGLPQPEPGQSTVDVQLAVSPVPAGRPAQPDKPQASPTGQDAGAAAAAGAGARTSACQGTAPATARAAGSAEALQSSPGPAGSPPPTGPDTLRTKPVAGKAGAEGEQRPPPETRAAKEALPSATAAAEGATGPVAASLSPHKAQARASLWHRSNGFNHAQGSHGPGLFRKILSFLGPDHPELAPEASGAALSLSLPELKCAYLHACAVYGDLEVYVDGAPAQTFCKAITKFTDVPEADVVYGVWRSEVYKPGHCLSIDRRMEKIVISIRGTYENSDIMSDLVARPVTRKFADGVEGIVHIGILKAAEYVVQSVWSALQTALLLAPGLPILVTGHSMGGGAAGLVALLLRHELRLPVEVRSRVRAVCLAPAAVMELELAIACQSFVASVILGNDVVPRVGLHTFAKFVQEVAQASPYQRAKRHVKRTWRALRRKARRLTGRGKRRPQRTSATGAGEVRPQAAAGAGGDVPAVGLGPPPAQLTEPSEVQHKILGSQLYAPGVLLWVLPQETRDGAIEPTGFAGGELDVPSPRAASAGPPADQQQLETAPPGTDTLATILASELENTPKPGMFSCACLAPPRNGEKSTKTSKSSKQYKYEMRQVGHEVFSEIFFFQKALTDHLPLEYLKGMRQLVLQQELAVHGQHDLREPGSTRASGAWRSGMFLNQFKAQRLRNLQQATSMPATKEEKPRGKHLKLRSSRW